MYVPEKRKPWCEIIDRKSTGHTALHVGEAVGERERQLLHGGSAGFPDVIAGNGDGIPLGRVLRAPLEAVDDET